MAVGSGHQRHQFFDQGPRLEDQCRGPSPHACRHRYANRPSARSGSRSSASLAGEATASGRAVGEDGTGGRIAMHQHVGEEFDLPLERIAMIERDTHSRPTREPPRASPGTSSSGIAATKTSCTRRRRCPGAHPPRQDRPTGSSGPTAPTTTRSMVTRSAPGARPATSDRHRLAPWQQRQGISASCSHIRARA